MSAVLEVENLTVSMGVQQILHGVSLSVEEKGIYGVLGSNGVGKTTLMRAISGIYKPDGGTIRFKGELVSGLPSHAIVRAGISQAPEGRQIFSNMTVRENLLIGGGRHGLSELDHVASLFPILKERINQEAGSLSGGEQQMLCIGRALMGKPEILLLDEPSLGLAPKIVKAIFDLIEKIRSEGLSILIVEQNAKSVLRIADQAAVMEGGKIVLQGDAKELAADPRVAEAYLGGHAHV
ncbi:ABC transporter ATP-binding protein [Martelella sp. AMO21009]